jgi:hypothetical protein
MGRPDWLGGFVAPIVGERSEMVAVLRSQSNVPHSLGPGLEAATTGPVNCGPSGRADTDPAATDPPPTSWRSVPTFHSLPPRR